MCASYPSYCHHYGRGVGIKVCLRYHKVSNPLALSPWVDHPLPDGIASVPCIMMAAQGHHPYWVGHVLDCLAPLEAGFWAGVVICPTVVRALQS